MKDQYTSPSEFSSDFSKDYKNYWNQANEIDQKIERLKKKKEQLFYPRLEEQLQKIVPEIQKALKVDAFEVTTHDGGLSNRVSVWFRKGRLKNPMINPYENIIGCLYFAKYNDGEICLVANFNSHITTNLKNLTLEELVKKAKENK